MQLDLFPTGPLGRGARPFADSHAPRPDAPAMLARLLDLRGGVHLAERLDDVWAQRDQAAAAAPDPLPDLGVIATIEARLDAAFADPMRPRYRLPDPARIAQLATAARDRKRAARAVWGPFAEFLLVHHKRARFALGELSQAVHAALLTRGGEVAALVQVAQGIEVATATRLADLRRSVAHAIERQAAQAMQRVALNDGEAIWACIAPIFADARIFYRALLSHQRQALLDLMHACGVGALKPAPDGPSTPG